MAKRRTFVRRHAWAVNYATELDWECARDDGYESVETLASVNGLTELFVSAKQALDAGEAAWRADHREDALAGDDPDERNEHDELMARLTREDDKASSSRTLKDGETFVVLICARRFTLPVTP